MSVNSEIQRISSAVADAYDAVDDMGGTLPSSQVVANLADAIKTIPQGGGSAVTVTDETDSHGGTIKHISAVELTNDTVTAAHLEAGYTAHDRFGNPITGILSPGGGTIWQDSNGYVHLGSEGGSGSGGNSIESMLGLSTAVITINSTTLPNGAESVVTTRLAIDLMEDDNGYWNSAQSFVLSLDGAPASIVVPYKTGYVSTIYFTADLDTGYAMENNADTTYSGGIAYDNTDFYRYVVTGNGTLNLVYQWAD